MLVAIYLIQDSHRVLYSVLHVYIQGSQGSVLVKRRCGRLAYHAAEVNFESDDSCLIDPFSYLPGGGHRVSGALYQQRSLAAVNL